jgi:branched-chain amino acid transport system substrate-binding protein
MLTKSVLTGAVVIALCLAASACGSSTSSGPGSAGTSDAPSSLPSGTPIKVGIAAALTGPEASQIASIPAVGQAWASMINAAGGIGGHSVQVITLDTKGDPATFQSVLKTLVQTDHVSGIFTSDNNADGSGGAYLQAAGIPVIGGNGYDLSLWGKRPNYYTNVMQVPTTLTSQALLAKAVGASKFGAVVCAEIAACTQAGLVFKSAAESEGVAFTGVTTAAVAAPDYTAQCLGLIQKGTDFISLSTSASVDQRLIPDCTQQGFTGTYGINASTFVQSLAATYGSSAKIAGNLQAFPWWANAPGPQQFRDAMAKYEPNADYRTSNDTAVWAALQLFAYAIGTPGPGPLSPATVTADYDKIKNVTLNGLLPQPITFTAGQGSPPVKCFWLYTYKPGDKNPTHIQAGPSGNGASGDLSTSCV